MTGIDSSELPIGGPHSADTAGTQFDDKVPASLAVPVVKQEPLDPQTLPPPFSRELTAKKGRREDEFNADRGANVDDHDSQFSKRGRFSTG